MGIIYKITNPNGRIYVGKTYDLRKRIIAHKSSAKRGRNHILHNSIRKYGFDNHVLEVIEEVDDASLDEREMYWIAELKSYCYDNQDGMNMTKGGEGQRSTWMHKTELRKYFSELFKGEKGPFYGRKHTDEAKRIMSEKSSKRNKELGIKVPDWGVEKGRAKVRKPVLLYNSDGNFVREFKSTYDCARYLNVCHGTVSGVLRGKTKSCKKHFIFYKKDNYPLKVEVKFSDKIREDRKIICIKNGVEQRFENAREASLKLGIPKTTINRAAYYNNGRPIRKGYSFIYAD